MVNGSGYIVECMVVMVVIRGVLNDRLVGGGRCGWKGGVYSGINYVALWLDIHCHMNI